MWPFICQFIEKLFRETIEPAVRGAHTHLSTFSFTRVDMGQQVCFSSSFLTCAPLERTLSCVTLFSCQAVFWKAGCVQALPGSPVSGSLRLCPLWCLCQSRSVCGPLSRTFSHQLPLYSSHRLSCWRGGLLWKLTNDWHKLEGAPMPPACFKSSTSGLQCWAHSTALVAQVVGKVGLVLGIELYTEDRH